MVTKTRMVLATIPAFVAIVIVAYLIVRGANLSVWARPVGVGMFGLSALLGYGALRWSALKRQARLRMALLLKCLSGMFLGIAMITAVKDEWGQLFRISAVAWLVLFLAGVMLLAMWTLRQHTDDLS